MCRADYIIPAQDWCGHTLLRAVNHHYDIIIIGSGAGGGTMAQALSADLGAHPRPRARRFRSAGRARTGIPKRSGRSSATAPRSAGSTTAGREFPPYTHYGVGGNTKFWGSVLLSAAAARTSRRSSTSTASRRRGRSTTRRSRRTTIAPSGSITCAAQHGVDPTEPPRGPYPYARGAARRRAWPRSSNGSAAQGLHPSPLPLGLLEPAKTAGASSATPATRSCASFTRRAKPRSAASGRRLERPNVTLGPTRCARRLMTDAIGTRGSTAVEVERNGEHGARRGAARHRVLRRGQLGGAAAAVGERRSIRTVLANSSGLVGRALHGAPGDDDGGRSIRSGRTRRCSRRPSAINDFYLRGPRTRVSARADPVAGADARRDGADRASPWIPLWAYDAWVRARRRLAGDVGGSAARRRTASPSTRTGASASTTARTTSARTRGWSTRPSASCGASASGSW